MIVRWTNPEASLALIPWYIPNGATRADIGLKLYDRLIKYPNDTFVLVAIEDRRIRAVLIGYARKDDVLVWQAHAGLGFSHSREMFSQLCEWAAGKGYTKLSIETKRSPLAYNRRWGFMITGTYTDQGNIYYKMTKRIGEVQ